MDRKISEGFGAMSTKRSSIDTDELIKRIHASKPKSVFLDEKPKIIGHKHAFSKKGKVGIDQQGLQSVKRAAFATETSNEVGFHFMKYFLLIQFIVTTEFHSRSSLVIYHYSNFGSNCLFLDL